MISLHVSLYKKTEQEVCIALAISRDKSSVLPQEVALKHNVAVLQALQH